MERPRIEGMCQRATSCNGKGRDGLGGGSWEAALTPIVAHWRFLDVV
jgi:hypothetical protein